VRYNRTRETFNNRHNKRGPAGRLEPRDGKRKAQDENKENKKAKEDKENGFFIDTNPDPSLLVQIKPDIPISE
jgi:hypothetical protein